LYNVPVSASDTNTYSTLNQLGEGYITQQGTNKGKGRNYGIELSLEKYLSHNYYFLLSSSLYKSKYTASDNIERNTRFAGNYVNNLVAGKDFIYSRGSRRLGLNLKIALAGGFRDTPIDTDKSRQSGYTVYIEKQAFSYQFPAFFRTDARISYQWNKRHHTSTLSLDIQNVTNRINVYDRYYDPLQDKIVSQSNNGLIPVLNYKIEF
jgi:outer membrane receptor protein involved in Fe transport